MIVGNFYNIKNTNGLFYYGIDYLRERSGLVRKLLVRPALVDAMQRAMPDCEVVACTPSKFFLETLAAAIRDDLLYTPTPHPIPFLTRQWIVVHDRYPFTASLGTLKRALLRISLATSRCRVGYINESETLPFLLRQGVATSRLIFAPNKIGTAGASVKRPMKHTAGSLLRIGLVGTDSQKKNYGSLFDAVRSSSTSEPLQFKCYGHRTAYFDALEQDHSDIALNLIESDHHSLAEFVDGIDVLVSIADQEGFGRPIAVAAAAGIPCMLLSKPVFKEFFSSALFFEDVPKLVAQLGRYAAIGLPQAPAYIPPPRVVQGYANAVAALQRNGASGR